MPVRPIIDYASAPFNGPFALSSIMLDGVTAALFEGVWIPVSFAKSGSFEFLLGGTGPSGTVQIWGTNQPNPVNTYTVTIGGSETDGDTLTLTFKAPGMPAQAINVTTAGGEGLPAIATAFATAINANATLGGQGLGVSAVAVGAVITINWPSISPNQPISGPTQPGSPPPQNVLSLAASKSGGASETLTIALGTDGTELASLTANGISSPPTIPFPIGFVKARLTALAGTNPTATLNFNGAA